MFLLCHQILEYKWLLYDGEETEQDVKLKRWFCWIRSCQECLMQLSSYNLIPSEKPCIRVWQKYCPIEDHEEDNCTKPGALYLRWTGLTAVGRGHSPASSMIYEAYKYSKGQLRELYLYQYSILFQTSTSFFPSFSSISRSEMLLPAMTIMILISINWHLLPISSVLLNLFSTQ